MIQIDFPSISRKVFVCDNVQDLKIILADRHKLEVHEFQDEITEIYACVGEVRNWDTKGKEVLMFLNLERLSSKDKNFIVATIAHECIHASIAVMRTIGDRISDDNEERIAYEADYILSSILDEYDIT